MNPNGRKIREKRITIGIKPTKAEGEITISDGISQSASQGKYRSIIDVLSVISPRPTSNNETAPFELLISRNETQELQYAVSLASAGNSASETKRQQELIDWFADQYELTEVSLPESVLEADSEAGIELFACWPNAKFEHIVPKFTESPWRPGELVAVLTRWLDSTNDQWPWVLQVLGQPCPANKPIHPAHQDETCLQLAIRCAIQTEVKTPEINAGTKSVEIGAPPGKTRLRMGQNLPITDDDRTGKKKLAALQNAQIRPETGFSAPSSYAQGVLVPPQQVLSLEYGVGGVDTLWDAVASEAAQRLLSPTLPVGLAPLSAGTETNTEVGLSTPGVVLTVDESHRNRLLTAQDSLSAHLQLDSPTVVVANDTDLLKYCGQIYSSRVDSPQEFDVTHLSPTEVETLGEHDQKQRRELLQSWLVNASSLMLIDVPAESDGWASEQVLCDELEVVVSRLNEAKDSPTPAADLIYFETPDSPLGPPFSRNICDAIATAQSSGVYLTVHTVYPEVARDGLPPEKQSYNEWVSQTHPTFASLTQHVDLLFAANSNLTPRFFRYQHADWTQESDSLHALIDDSLERSWVGCRRAPTANSNDVSMPAYRLRALQEAADEIEVSADYRRQLVDLFSATHNSGKSPNQSETATAADDGTATHSEITKAHAVRSFDDIAVTYDAGQQGYVCETCRAAENTTAQVYDRSADGLMQALTCCQSLTEIDRETIRQAPRLHVPEETLTETELTRSELQLLQLVYLAQSGELHPATEFDIIVDSCVKLRNDVGLDAATETELADGGYIIRNTTQQKRYSLTAKGLRAIGKDPSEHEELPSLFERCLQKATTLALKAEYGDRPGYDVEQDVVCDVAATASAHPSRAPLDVAVIDSDGDIETGAVVWPPLAGVGKPLTDDAQPGELSLADVHGVHQTETVVKYQTLVAAAPATMLWCVLRQKDAAALQSLLEEASENSRIEFNAGYPDNVRIQDYQLDEPGITDVKSLKHLLDATEPEYHGTEDGYALDLTEEQQ